jgi:RND family efflux transporter MFP subunit
MSKIIIILLAAAGLILSSGCKRTSDHHHDAESAEEHAAHANESSGTAGHDHENESVDEQAAQAGEAEHADDDAGSLIAFPLKLQRQFGIETMPVERRKVHQTIRAMGEIKPAGSREAEVIAPFSGILMPDIERGIVRPGERVRKGEHLAVLAPSTDESGWSQLLSEFRLAQAEFDRARELAKAGAAAPRRVQEAELALSQKATRLRAALGGADPSNLDSISMIFHLTAPAAGILSDVHLRFGQRVQMGEHLFNIIDPSRVWLEAQVPVSETERLERIGDAYFTVGGNETIYRTADLNGLLVTVGGLLDPVTRRVPVIFEIDNPKNIFKPGSYAQVFLRESTHRESPAIPRSAVLDEDGIPVAMLQVDKEDFRKIVLKTGSRDEDYVEVLSGLDEGDRVVVEGAYKVKLGANKPAADAHAGHRH